MRSDTHYSYLYIYVFLLNVCVYREEMICKLIIVCLVPRIIQAIHLLTHETNSHTNRYCNHKSIANVALSTWSSFMYENIFTSCVYVKKMVHHTHHLYPTNKELDYTYYYTVANSFGEAIFKCGTTPESEFVSSLYLCDIGNVALSVVVRALLMYSLVKYTSVSNLLVSALAARIPITLFYYNAFHKQHTDIDGKIIPLGMNWEPQYFIDVLNSLLFGRLGVEEGYGHEMHHKFPTMKPRFYNAVPTHTMSGVKLSHVCPNQ